MVKGDGEGVQEVDVGNASDEASIFDITHDKKAGEQTTNKSQELPQVGRSTREWQLSMKYSSNEHILLTNRGESECYDETYECGQNEECYKPCKRKLIFCIRTTYDLVKLPVWRKALKDKWVFCFKCDETNSHPQDKARSAVMEFSQKKLLY